MAKLKGFSTLICILFLLTTVLAACGGNNTPAATPTPTPAPVAEATPTPEPEETYDLGGRVIKIAAWWDLTPAGQTQGEINRLDKIAEVEKKYNVKIEFVNVPFGEMVPNATTSILAGEPFVDILQLEYKSAITMIKKGMLLPVSEFTNEKHGINNNSGQLIKFPELGGDYYGFDNPLYIGAGIHYNRDLFASLGLPDLKELYTNGEWTWDKFVEIAKLATRDTNNDGTPDVYGFSGWATDTYKHFSVANGVKIVDEITGTEQLSSPASIKTGEFLYNLYHVDNVVKVKTGDPVNWEETHTFKDGDVAMFTAHEWNLGGLSFEFGIVPFPKGPDQTTNYTYAYNNASAKFIPKGVKDPLLVYQIYEETFDIPMLEEYSGQDYLESIYQYQDDVDTLRNDISGTGLIIVDEAFPNFPVWSFVNDIVVNKISPATAAETYKAQAAESATKLGE